MRSGDWKYLVTAEGELLFDLSQDIGEKHNLAGDRANTLRLLREKYAEWERQVLTPIPLTDTH